jgi:hypothetical protein
MDVKREDELFKICADEYDCKGMSGFADFVDKYSGAEGDIKYLTRLKNIVEIRNYFAKFRIFTLSSYNSLEELLDETLGFAYPQFIVKTSIFNDDYFESVASLRVKLEEYFFSNSHRQF